MCKVHRGLHMHAREHERDCASGVCTGDALSLVCFVPTFSNNTRLVYVAGEVYSGDAFKRKSV